MELKITSQDYATLTADQPRGRAILGAVMVISGLSILFLSVIIVAFGVHWIIITILFILGVGIALFGVPLALKEECLIITPGRKRIERQALWFYLFHVSRRVWDTTFISSVDARIITEPESPEQIGVFFKYTNGEEERVLTEIGSKIPYNCIKYVNMMLEDKEVPEGIFRD